MAFNKDIPTSGTSLKASNPQILANQSALQEAMAKNHQFEGTDAATQTGKHEVLEMIEKASAGASSAGEGHFQTIDSGTQAELAFTSEDGTEVQLTSAGKSGSATTDLLANNATVAGTLGVTGVATLGDGSLLATSAAPTTDAMIANKKFVNDIVGTEADGQVTPTTTGFQFFAIDGVSTKVFTKYLTGTTDNDAETTVAHGFSDFDTILSVSASIFDSVNSFYSVSDFYKAGSPGIGWGLIYDATNVILYQVDANLRVQNYRIKIEYTA